MKTAVQFLNVAKDTLEARGVTYDSPEGERSMQATVEAFNVITGRERKGTGLSEAEGWLFMQVLKDVRQWQKEEYHEDSALDALAYAALKAESLAGGGK